MPSIISGLSRKSDPESFVVLKILVTAFTSAIPKTCFFKIGN
jgi:hypothetical protein